MESITRHGAFLELYLNLAGVTVRLALRVPGLSLPGS